MSIISIEDRVLIRQLILSGMEYKTICEKMECSYYSIIRIAKEFGIKQNTSKKIRTQERYIKIKELRDKGMKLKQIAFEMNLHLNRVWNILKYDVPKLEGNV